MTVVSCISIRIGQGGTGVDIRGVRREFAGSSPDFQHTGMSKWFGHDRGVRRKGVRIVFECRL